MKKNLLFIALISLFFSSCKDKLEPEKVVDARVPVTLTTIDSGGIQNYVELNGTATYLANTVIQANATG